MIQPLRRTHRRTWLALALLLAAILLAGLTARPEAPLAGATSSAAEEPRP